MKDKEALKEYWAYIKKEINPLRKKGGMPEISYREAKALLRRIQLMGVKRG